MFNCLRVTPCILSAKHIRATTWLGLKAQLQWVLVLLTTNRLTWRRIDMTYPQLPDLLLHKCCLISLVHSKRVDRRLAPARKMLQMQQTGGTNQNHNQLTTLKRNRWKLKNLKPFLIFSVAGGPSSCSKTHGQSNKTRRSRNRGSPGLEWLFLRDIKQILGKMLSMKRKEWRPQSFKERVKKLRLCKGRMYGLASLGLRRSAGGVCVAGAGSGGFQCSI